MRNNSYPCIKKYVCENYTVVVLFDGERSGTVIQTTDNNSWSIGDYCTGWYESKFQPFNESITLYNEVLNNAK